ncbi:MAG: hypothetical protein M3Y28_05210 [Armatimonadota bacterium]|nr:hypothetical protein [Armatimonadota bacterium]
MTTPTKDEVAQTLIRWHFTIEPATREIYRFLATDEATADEPIKLLEINQATMETGRIDTFPFGPAGDIPYPTVIAQITPEEMQRVRDGSIVLPKGWDLSRAQQFHRPRGRRSTAD